MRYLPWFAIVFGGALLLLQRLGAAWSERAYHLGDAAAINRLDQLENLSVTLFFALLLFVPALLLTAALRRRGTPKRPGG